MRTRTDDVTTRSTASGDRDDAGLVPFPGRPDQTSGPGRFTALRTSLSEEFAAQTTRLKQLTTAGDPSEADNRAALLVATRQSLEQISGALRRLAEGTYGICEECDAAIPSERLEVLPHARYCVACQQKRHG